MSSVSAQTELKALQRRKSESDARLKQLFEERGSVNDRIRSEQEQNASLNKAIETFKLSQREPIVSEHAQLRYLERVRGVNLQEVSAQVLPQEIIAVVKQLGDGTYPAGTHKVKVRGGVVVTILANEEKG